MSNHNHQTKALKRLEICPKCTGYMRPESPIAAHAVRNDWKHETKHRSFGGVEIRRFVCEKCHHVEVFQTDDLGFLGEDD